ncbi:hypothetical protein [Flavobacterium facile]|uniref:hypothetical protein n=1 Tax=Flavobacterium facile TaxID=2893174 RepID=UPI002E79DCDD|nr:hypothetical protein [Flavobacterium sp. T-12]
MNDIPNTNKNVLLIFENGAELVINPTFINEDSLNDFKKEIFTLRFEGTMKLSSKEKEKLIELSAGETEFN